MANKKLIPIVLIGAGVLAAGYALLSKPASNNNGNLPVPPSGNGNIFSDWSTALTNLFAAVTGGVSTINTALKSTGNYTSVNSKMVYGQNLCQLQTASQVKNLKAGNQVQITALSPNTLLSGQYDVVEVGTNSIVISRQFDIIGIPQAFTGTYKEV